MKLIATAIAVVAASAANAETLLLLDLKSSTGPVASTGADFATYDGLVDPAAPVTDITATGVTALGDFSIELSGGGGPFNTANGGITDDVPIYDGYQFAFNSFQREFTLSGLETVAGESLSITLFGAGDRTTAFTEFELTYNGTTFPVKVTMADALATGFTTFFFDAVAGADSATVRWGKSPSSPGGGGAGFNGLALTIVPEPIGLSLVAIGIGLMAVQRRRR